MRSQVRANRLTSVACERKRELGGLQGFWPAQLEEGSCPKLVGRLEEKQTWQRSLDHCSELPGLTCRCLLNIQAKVSSRQLGESGASGEVRGCR